MRIWALRGDSRPGVRIEGLRRYAFIGDSTMYGAGVPPDETLSSSAERQMNEMMPAWPVEAVNLGVCGYNLWNSWLEFKNEPQVYDGVVLALCNNDADLFDRTYQVAYPPSTSERWENHHPTGAAVTRCFDDISSFSREQPLPVAVIFYNTVGHHDQVRIGEIIGNLCASRGFCFIHTLTLYRERNFSLADLRVSSANGHPSAAAHDAVGRHLALTLKQQGWFRQYEESTVGMAPDRIITAARAMVERDHYPADAALAWALRTLGTKSRLAQRIKGSGGDDDFSSAASSVADVLSSSSRRWHMRQRTRAFTRQIRTREYSMGPGLFSMQEEKLRLEELGFALGTGDWGRLADVLPPAEPPPPITGDDLSASGPAFLDACSLELSRFLDSVEWLRCFAAPTPIESPFDDASMVADLEALSQVAGRIQAECAALRTAILRLESTFSEVRSSLSEPEIERLSSHLSASFRRIKTSLGFVSRMVSTIARIKDADPALFTTVEITIRCEAIEGKPLCVVVGHAEYNVPQRQSFDYADNFLLDGSPALVKLYFPTFYGGRISFRARYRQPVVSQPVPANPRLLVEATLIKVELKNGPRQFRVLDPAMFVRDQNGRFNSPLIHLP